MLFCLIILAFTDCLMRANNVHPLFSGTQTEDRLVHGLTLSQTSIRRQNRVSCIYVISICRPGGQVCEEVWNTISCLVMCLVMRLAPHRSMKAILPPCSCCFPLERMSLLPGVQHPGVQHPVSPPVFTR